MSFLKHHPAAHSVVGRDALDVGRPVGAARVAVVPTSAVDDEPTRAFGEGGPTDTLRELLLALEGGDPGAVAALEHRIGGLVRVNIRRVLRDVSRADAVTREFFAGVRRDVTSFDPDRDGALVWLLTRAYLAAMSGLTSADAASRRTDRPHHLGAGSGHSAEPAAQVADQ